VLEGQDGRLSGLALVGPDGITDLAEAVAVFLGRPAGRGSVPARELGRVRITVGALR
jgi:hypothetical protein